MVPKVFEPLKFDCNSVLFSIKTYIIPFMRTTAEEQFCGEFHNGTIIFQGYGMRIEKSVTQDHCLASLAWIEKAGKRVTDWHHKACRVIQSDDLPIHTSYPL